MLRIPRYCGLVPLGAQEKFLKQPILGADNLPSLWMVDNLTLTAVRFFSLQAFDQSRLVLPHSE